MRLELGGPLAFLRPGTELEPWPPGHPLPRALLLISPFTSPQAARPSCPPPPRKGQAGPWPLLPGSCSIQLRPSLGLEGAWGH